MGEELKKESNWEIIKQNYGEKILNIIKSML